MEFVKIFAELSHNRMLINGDMELPIFIYEVYDNEFIKIVKEIDELNAAQGISIVQYQHTEIDPNLIRLNYDGIQLIFKKKKQ